MDPIRHRREGAYLRSGWVNTPCAKKSAEFGNRHKCKRPRAAMSLT